MTKHLSRLAWVASLAGGLAGTPLRAAELPDFSEVFGLVRSNLTEISPAELNRAALEGLLQQLPSQIVLVTNTTADTPTSGEPTAPLLSKSAVYDEAFGYVRVARVAPGLRPALEENLRSLMATNALKGLVLDLRYAHGADYAAAAEAGDLFLAEERPLLNWGEATARSTAKTNAFAPPLAVLVNAQTRGAAEALAGLLRQTKAGLTLGAPTAGQANIFKEFILREGVRLRVATARVKLGDESVLPATGLTPDIPVKVAPEEEKLYYADAYRAIAKLATTAAAARAPTNLAGLGTNRSGRINEAELVRMRREGTDLDLEARPAPLRSTAPDKPIVTDPPLARALDLLKGLAVVHAAARRS